MRKCCILLALCGTAIIVVFTTRGLLPSADPMAPFQDLIAHADSIGELQLLPMDGYWEEWKSADAEDEKEGFKRKRPLSMSIMSRNWRPDVSKYGPRLRACEEKWRPIIERNHEISECRRAALQELSTALSTRLEGLKGESLSLLHSNIVVRANLSPVEADWLFSRRNTQATRRCPDE